MHILFVNQMDKMDYCLFFWQISNINVFSNFFVNVMDNITVTFQLWLLNYIYNYTNL